MKWRLLITAGINNKVKQSGHVITCQLVGGSVTFGNVLILFRFIIQDDVTGVRITSRPQFFNHLIINNLILETMEKTYSFQIKLMSTVHTITVIATSYNWQVKDNYIPKGEITEEESFVMNGSYENWGKYHPYVTDSNRNYSLIFWELRSKILHMIESDKSLMKAVKADWIAFYELESKFNANSTQP